MHCHIIAKLVAPRADRIVRRARVLAAIDGGLRAGSCWVAAPAGYGKTIAVTDYLQKRSAPYIWYRVDEGDQDSRELFSLHGGVRAGRPRRRSRSGVRP